MKLSYLLLFSFFLFACNQVPLADPYAPPPPGQLDTPSSDQPQSEFGVLKCRGTEEQQKLFHAHLQKFLSSTVHPNSVPIVKCSNRDDIKGGAFIRGKVNFEGGAVFDPNSETQQLEVSENSYLEIHVADIYDKAFVEGVKLKAIPFGGFVDGQSITLAFEDQKGKVYMDGTIVNGIFSGPFKFENFINWKGEPGSSGQLGIFSIHPCSLFNCGQK